MRVVIAKPGSYQYVCNTCCDDATLHTYKGVVFTLCPVHGVKGVKNMNEFDYKVGYEEGGFGDRMVVEFDRRISVEDRRAIRDAVRRALNTLITPRPKATTVPSDK